MSLLALPTSCELIKPIIIEDAANIGAVDITLRYAESLFAITDVADGDSDVTESNLEHNHNGTVQIVAFQTDNPGLKGLVTLASVTLAGDLSDLGSLNMTVNTLKDATPHCSPIDSTVDGFTVTALSPEQSPAAASPSTGHISSGGGGINYPALTPAPSPATTSVAGTPVEEVSPTPEQILESCTEPPSIPSPISSPTTGIVIVAVATIFGIVMVTRATEDRKKVTIATIEIAVVAVAAIVGMVMMT